MLHTALSQGKTYCIGKEKGLIESKWKGQEQGILLEPKCKGHRNSVLFEPKCKGQRKRLLFEPKCKGQEEYCRSRSKDRVTNHLYVYQQAQT